MMSNGVEIFYNRESKSGEFEITYNSSKDEIEIMQWDEQEKLTSFYMNKKSFTELKKFLKSIRLTKNVKIKKLF